MRIAGELPLAGDRFQLTLDSLNVQHHAGGPQRAARPLKNPNDIRLNIERMGDSLLRHRTEKEAE